MGIIKDQRFRDRAIGPHRGNQGADGGVEIDRPEQVTKHIRVGVVIQQRQLIGRPVFVGEGDLFQ